MACIVPSQSLVTEGDIVGNEILANVDISGVVLAGENGIRRIEMPRTAIPLVTATAGK